MSAERPFSTSESQQRLHAGPLARAIDGFAAWLAIEGYACRSAAAKLRFVESLSRWLEHEDLKLKEKAMAKTTSSHLPSNRYRPDLGPFEQSVIIPSPMRHPTRAPPILLHSGRNNPDVGIMTENADNTAEMLTSRAASSTSRPIR